MELSIAASVGRQIVSVGEARREQGGGPRVDSGIGCGGSPMGGGHRLPLCGYHRRVWVTVFRNSASE